MASDAAVARGERPVAFLSLVEDPTATAVAEWVRDQL
jgi:urease accessory protein